MELKCEIGLVAGPLPSKQMTRFRLTYFAPYYCELLSTVDGWVHIPTEGVQFTHSLPKFGQILQSVEGQNHNLLVVDSSSTLTTI